MSFLNDVKLDEILLFTTFTLDEAVLAELLVPHVARNQSIVVFHDILRHRNPGFLRSKFPNAMVYSVQLTQTNEKRCPVFHSKLWARIQTKGGQQSIRHLVVTSANLSPYHLTRREGGTLESYKCFSGIDVPVPQGDSIFDLSYLLPSKQLLSRGVKRISLDPHSLIVDARKSFELTVTSEPIVNTLKSLGVATLCAGPFVCDSAIAKHLSPPRGFRVFDEPAPKSGFALHAKVMRFSDCVVLGSVNWTAQAMGVLGKRPINHETLLILKGGNNTGKALKGYPFRSLGSKVTNVPGDSEPDDESSGDWLFDRNLRIHAPDQALLIIERGKAHIKLLGEFVGATSVLLRCTQDDEKLSVHVKGRVIAEPTDANNANRFAAILESGNVELIGLFRGRKVWRVFLDYGIYWPALEVQRKKREKQGVGTGRTNMPSETQGAVNLDVRDMRQLVIQNPEKGRSIVEFTRWLVRHKRSAVMIPLWCGKLADRLHERAQ